MNEIIFLVEDAPEGGFSARALGYSIFTDARRFLDDNNSYRFFEPLDALLKTGPTGTNVADVRVLLIP